MDTVMKGGVFLIILKMSVQYFLFEDPTFKLTKPRENGSIEISEIGRLALTIFVEGGRLFFYL